MSQTVYIYAGKHIACYILNPDWYLELTGDEAVALKKWLGVPLPPDNDVFGKHSAKDMGALCRRRLWPEFVSLESRRFDVSHQHIIRTTRSLLKLCERAGDDILWFHAIDDISYPKEDEGLADAIEDAVKGGRLESTLAERVLKFIASRS